MVFRNLSITLYIFFCTVLFLTKVSNLLVEIFYLYTRKFYFYSIFIYIRHMVPINDLKKKHPLKSRVDTKRDKLNVNNITVVIWEPSKFILNSNTIMHDLPAIYYYFLRRRTQNALPLTTKSHPRDPPLIF